MFARSFKTFTFSRAERFNIFAYGAIVAMSAGITILIMSKIDGTNLVWADQQWFSQWIILSGALSGGIALALARGWMGMEGALGLARAIVGTTAMALIAAMTAGLLIDPLIGVVYGPVLLATEFLAKPWLATAWMVVGLFVHYMQLRARRERDASYIASKSPRAMTQLSQLSQQNLYRRS